MDSVMDDVDAPSQYKAPFGSSNTQSYEKPLVPVTGGASSRRLTTEDALNFLKSVKETFSDQKTYIAFIEVMKDFKAKRTDTAGVIVKVKELFKGHNNLLLGFNTFLPKGFKIVPDVDEPKKTVDIRDSIGLLKEIKDHHVYTTFLDILQKYLKVRRDEKLVYNEVAVLFDKHPELVDEFTRFLHPKLQQMHVEKKPLRDLVSTDGSVYGSELDDVKAMVEVLKKQMEESPEEDIMDYAELMITMGRLSLSHRF